MLIARSPCRAYNSSQRGNGIQLYNTKRAQILHNHVSFVRDAIYVDVSHDAVFRGNRLHHSRYGSHYMNSYYNLWEDNEAYHNRGGLALMMAQGLRRARDHPPVRGAIVDDGHRQ